MILYAGTETINIAYWWKAHQSSFIWLMGSCSVYNHVCTRCTMFGDGFPHHESRGAFPKLIDRLLSCSQWTMSHFAYSGLIMEDVLTLGLSRDVGSDIYQHRKFLRCRKKIISGVFSSPFSCKILQWLLWGTVGNGVRTGVAHLPYELPGAP